MSCETGTQTAMMVVPVALVPTEPEPDEIAAEIGTQT